jgi:hypothetical protein
MEPISLQLLRYSAVTWALWKGLDYLTKRWRDYRDSMDAPPSGAVEPAAVVLALSQLADAGSPVLQAIAGIEAARRMAPASLRQELDARLAPLSRAEQAVAALILAAAWQ